MKLAIASDVHLEFGDLDLRNTQGADILILAGDICTVKDFRTSDSSNKYSRRYHAFFEQVSREFQNVIYVLGNHEHYGNDMAYTKRNISDRLAHLTNIRVIEREQVEIEGITFVGTTLWTSLNNRDPHVMWRIAPMMSDFSRIKVDVRQDIIHNHPPTLTPDIWCDEHDRCRRFLENSVKQDPTVVITHFTPSYKSRHTKYLDDHIMNAAFHTEMFDFVHDNPQIKLWIHGHTHDGFDYMINQTRVVCNPRGYAGYEPQVDTWDLKYVEV